MYVSFVGGLHTILVFLSVFVEAKLLAFGIEDGITVVCRSSGGCRSMSLGRMSVAY